MCATTWVQGLILINHKVKGSTRYMSPTLRLRHTNGADWFHFSLCVNFHQVQVHCVSTLSQLRQSEAFQHKYAGLLFLADAGAQHSNSAEFSTKQKGSHASKQQ